MLSGSLEHHKLTGAVWIYATKRAVGAWTHSIRGPQDTEFVPTQIKRWTHRSDGYFKDEILPASFLFIALAQRFTLLPSDLNPTPKYSQ